MRAVVQIVRDASVEAEGRVSGKIDRGLLVYMGVARGDTFSDAEYLAEKTAALRIFDDGEGRMNLSVQDIKGGVLAVSQFTLLADARKGRRPSYSNAADPSEAKPLYEWFMERIRARGLSCEGGVFRARMLVKYTNDGPVTVLLDSKKQF
ncbi:MAG: D-tyrosyl-tRNA(Tyr) deacylase [Treponema sp.]|jgi:D-tyrosyl-tRNA(Tyr) deacylase|nr:D-tyrosyl-tRNA(Tyr) deacylase [Treponema sp.]